MLKQMEYWERACDYCGSDKLEEVWRYETQASTKHYLYDWTVRNVICSRCGFVFVSPCPSESSLNEYYADSYAYWSGQSVDYSLDKRLALLRKHISDQDGLTFVEVGGNNDAVFRAAMSDLVAEFTSVEVNRSCDSQFDSIGELPENQADVLATYFVLEHVPHPIAFLASCARALRDEGMLVVEVPNLYVYPFDPNGLKWWEHTNHFSPHSLAALAATQGFHLLEISYQLCSRSFGFAAVFAKRSQAQEIGSPSEHGMGAGEYHLAQACVQNGLSLINTYNDLLAKVRDRIRSLAETGEGVVIWAANHVCHELLEEFELPESAVVVDSDPAKSMFLHPIPVYQPHAVREEIQQAKLIIINTRFHADSIVGFIRQELGREVREDDLLVIDQPGAMARSTPAAAMPVHAVPAS